METITQPLLFEGRCGRGATDGPYAEACGFSTNDREAFEDHMAGVHGVRKPRPTPQLKPWKPSRSRKPVEEVYADALYLWSYSHKGETMTVTGQFWSLGVRGTVWVVPHNLDLPGLAPLVQLKRYSKTGPWEMVGFSLAD